jgi:hypothetical protein
MLIRSKVDNGLKEESECQKEKYEAIILALKISLFLSPYLEM